MASIKHCRGKYVEWHVNCDWCLHDKISPLAEKVFHEFMVKGVIQKDLKWKEIRHNTLTASRISTVLGTNFFKTRQELLYEMATPIQLEDEPTSIAQQHGIDHEDYAIESYEKITGHKIIRPNPGICINPNFFNGRLGGSPDGITYCGILVEAKCPVSRKIGWTVPTCYIPQVQTMLHIMELDMCHFINLDVNNNECTLTVMNKNLNYFDEEQKETGIVYRDVIISFLTELELMKSFNHLNKKKLK